MVADIKGGMVADKEVGMVADKEVGMVANMEVEMVVDINVDTVADIEVDMVAITMEVASIINELATIFEPKSFQVEAFASPNFFKPKLIPACAFS